MKTSSQRSRETSRKAGGVARRSTKAQVIEMVPAKLRLASILVPLDFSKESEKALRYAVTFAEQFGARLILLNVVEPLPFADLGAIPLVMENEAVMAACQAKLEGVVARHRLPESLIEKRLVRPGQAFREIVEAARTLKADLIIISTHGYTGFQHVLLGSTAERVVRHAPCPVLVVRTHEKEFV
jgi:universal stress protein A